MQIHFDQGQLGSILEALFYLGNAIIIAAVIKAVFNQ